MKKICFLIITLTPQLFFSYCLANTLSQTYYTAVVDPNHFESRLSYAVNNTHNFYNKVLNCASITLNSLSKAEQQIKSQLPYAPSHLIPQLNQELTEIIEFKRTIEWLNEIILRHRNGDRNFYLNTAFANYAFTLHSISAQTNVPIDTLIFVRIRSLQSQPCN